MASLPFTLKVGTERGQIRRIDYLPDESIPSEKGVKMAYSWTTLEEGIRVRYHPTRKHGINPDVYYTIRQQIHGKRVEESLGWASKGMTLTKARIELAKLKEAARLGTGPTTLKEKRQDTQIQKEAKEKAAKQDTQSGTTVAMHWENSYLPQAKMHKKVASIKSEEHLFNKWIRPIIGDTPLQQLTHFNIAKISQGVLQAGRSPRTAQYALAVVSQIWNNAYLHSIVTAENPVRKIKKFPVENRRIRFLSKDEAQALLSEVSKHSKALHGTCVLSLFCGLRAGEIHNLTWADANFDEGLLFIKDTKSGKDRHAFMTTEVKQVLQARWGKQEKNTLIFPATTGSKRVQISSAFEHCVNALGLNDGITDRRQRVVFHTLRHTFASWLVKEGTPLYTVAALMGHASIQMTQRYSHLAPDTVRQAAMALQGYFDQV